MSGGSSMSSEDKFVGNYEREFIELVPRIAVTGPGGARLGGAKEGIAAAKRYLRDLEVTRGKIMLVGNGASASIASHMATDLWKNGGIRATAFNDSSLLTCISNDCSYEDVFRVPVEMFADKGDVLVCISSSGRSANILGAADAGKKRGCRVITLTGFEPDNPLRETGDINFYVPSPNYGPVEILHTYVLHCLNDLIIAENQSGG